MFKFTFSVGSGGYNPFSAPFEGQVRQQHTTNPATTARKLPPPPKRPLPPPSTSEDDHSSKKRGWAPSNSAASEPISQPALTNGWIDTPSRYLEAASQSHRCSGEDELETDFPPAKRRKTLADSIISTAFSAALIGTAVGMTAYRMWRDRGKPTGEPNPEPIEQPPPPYEKEEWVDDVPQVQPTTRSQRLPRKSRPITRRAPRYRMAAMAIPPPRSPIGGFSPSKHASTQLFEESNDDQEGELEHQMDWMGEKIRTLIEEGQKALGKEVVVMNDEGSDAEGAVDDGMDGWEEEGNQAACPSSPTLPDFRRSRPRPIQAPGINMSISSPARSGISSSMPTSPRFKRSRITTADNRSQVTPVSASSSYLDVARPPKLGCRTFDSATDIH